MYSDRQLVQVHPVSHVPPERKPTTLSMVLLLATQQPGHVAPAPHPFVPSVVSSVHASPLRAPLVHALYGTQQPGHVAPAPHPLVPSVVSSVHVSPLRAPLVHDFRTLNVGLL